VSIDPAATNQAAFERAQRVIPGGVNSPVRAFRAVGGTPRFIRRAQGPYLWDVEGRRYIDYIGSWGPMILGHGHPAVLDAVTKAAHDGLSFGAPTEAEAELAEAIIGLVPTVEQVRLVSSGTEAGMSALRLARGATGRPKIIKFEGCYHGHADALLVKAGSGLATFGHPTSAGVPPEVVQHTLVLEYNNVTQLEEAFAQHGRQLACVMIEAIAGNMNFVRASVPFITRLRELCTRHGALLIFDEVMTGFGRTGAAFASEKLGVIPDLFTFAKGVTSGTVPMGGVVARKGIHDALMTGPEHVIEFFHGYTYSAHPLACAAGLATLDVYRDEKLFERAAAIEGKWVEAFYSLKGLPNVLDIRQFGITGAVDLASRPDAFGKRAFEAMERAFHEFGLCMRITGETLAVTPPLTISDDQIGELVDKMARTIRAVA